MEVVGQLIVSQELNYIKEENYREIRNQIENVSYMLNQLRKSTLAKSIKPSKLTKP